MPELLVPFNYLTNYPENGVEIDGSNQVLVIKQAPASLPDDGNGKVVDGNKVELTFAKKCHSLFSCTVGIELDENFLIRLID